MKIKFSIKTIIIAILVIVVLFYTLFPIIWVIEGSLKTRTQNRSIPPVWIFTPTLRAWNELGPNFMLYFTNSLIVASSSVLLCLVLGLPTAYALARFKLKGRKNILMTILSTRMAPPFAFIVPYYLLMRDLRLLDTQLSLVLIYIGFNLSFVIWILEGFIEELPVEIEEAALVDGCSRLGVLRRITIPLIAPGIVVTATLTFIFCWNEFLFAYILTRETAVTLPPAIASTIAFMNIDWEKMCAYATASMIPSLTLALLVRKYLVRGLTLGAIK